MEATETVYTVAEVAGILRCHTSTVYRAVESGRLPAIRIGGGLRIPASSLRKLMEPLEK